MKAGLPSQDATLEDTTTARPSRTMPQPNEQFGHYRIIRQIGQGGMGAVFEAEDTENGRRLALKIMSHTLDSRDTRARFLREGRLAASINHPNSVYIFGTEEIAGMPVITMEFVTGGTLQDRVKQKGPLPVTEAVDSILQVIDGLEAAQRIGVLHRDVKPSNCFVDHDGKVKIGDFGLSINTAIRLEPAMTATGAFMGTPAFASPEQLRGDELNVRSDIYSVGVTLFYLLTGHAPFEGKNMVQVLAAVIEQPAPSPHKYRPDLASGLVKVIRRCLEKTASDRYNNYDELRQALASFSTTTPVPANLGMRFMAGILDHCLIGFIGAIVSLPWLLYDTTFDLLVNPLPFFHSSIYLVWCAIAALFTLFYFALLEGLRGASIGKMICRLRVAGPDRNPPGVMKALYRSLIVTTLPQLPVWISFGIGHLDFSPANYMPAVFHVFHYVILAFLFCTARRRNGLAGIHDLLTNTRVIHKPTCGQARPLLSACADTMRGIETNSMVGPYHVIEHLGKSHPGEWLLGFDNRLLRKVLIHVVPSGTPAITAPMRNLGRAGRLRWITGRRSDQDNWDAFEGITGQPLLNLLPQRQTWHQVRFWLLDLANEINAAEKDGTLPATLAMDRVWITAEGRAKLLDFPAPGIALPTNQPEAENPASHKENGIQRFLVSVAFTALEGRTLESSDPEHTIITVPLPLHARFFLDKLPALPSSEAIITALIPLLKKITAITRWQRAALVAGCIAFPLITAVSTIAGTYVMGIVQRSQPEIMQLSILLNLRQATHIFPAQLKCKRTPDDRAYSIYIASHFRQTITNESSWNSYFALAFVGGPNRRFAEESLLAYPKATEQEISEATKTLQPYLQRTRVRDNAMKSLKSWRFYTPIVGISLFVYVCIPSLLASLLFRGGLLLHAFSIAVIREDGMRASRLRVFWRSLIAWSPAIVALLMLASKCTPNTSSWSIGLAFVFVVVPAIVSILLPDRSLQDRIAGTRLVPR